MSDDTPMQDIHAIIGAAVTRLLTPDQHLKLHQLIAELQLMKVHSAGVERRDVCERAIRLLAQLMH